MRTPFQQRQYLHNLAIHSPSFGATGIAPDDRCFIFHWPSLWRTSAALLAPVLGIDPRATWEALRDAATPILPGQPLPLEDARVAAFLDTYRLLSDEVSACTAPFDATFLGRLPERWSHALTLARLPHWVRQLIHAVEDLADVSSPAETGVWRDPITNGVLINWSIRAARYPFGHPDTPLRAVNDVPWSIPNTLLHSADVRALVRCPAPHSVLGRCPWPDAADPALLTYFDVDDLEEQYFWLVRRPADRAPVVRRIWNSSFKPVDELLGEFISDKVTLPAAPVTDINRCREWCKTRDAETLHVQVVRLRLQWAMTLPNGIFLDKLEGAIPVADVAARDAWVADYRKEGCKSSFYPELHFHVFGGITYYDLDAMTVFMRQAPHYYVFEAARRRLLNINKDPTLITRGEPLRKPRVRDEDRTRAPRWTAKEDAALKTIFVNHKKADDADWQWLFSTIKGPLHPLHRTKKQVAARITTLNQQLKRSLTLHGYLSPEKQEEYAKHRLGQRDRA